MGAQTNDNNWNIRSYTNDNNCYFNSNIYVKIKGVNYERKT